MSCLLLRLPLADEANDVARHDPGWSVLTARFSAERALAT